MLDMFNSVKLMNSLLQEVKSIESKEEKINYLKKMIFKIDNLRAKLDLSMTDSIDSGLNPFEDDLGEKIILFRKMEDNINKVEYFLKEQLQDQKFRTIY